MRAALASFALLLSGFLQAAPVPFVREVAETEVKIKDVSVKGWTNHLLARDFLLRLSKDATVAALPCVKGCKNPIAWLTARVVVRPGRDSKGMRISLKNVPSKEAMVLLSALVEHYLNAANPTRIVVRQQLERYRMQEERLLELVKVRGLNADVVDRWRKRVAEQRARIETVDAGWVLQKPRLCKTSR